jgi:hypothetical protein
MMSGRWAAADATAPVPAMTPRVPIALPSFLTRVTAVLPLAAGPAH